MLELYHFFGATCGLKARLSLAEKNVSYQDTAVDRAYLKTQEYLALNPTGMVPTIIHDGEVVTESSVIINYVDDEFDGPALKPATSIGRARALWWMKRADEALSMIGVLTYTISIRDKILSEKSPAEVETYLSAIPVASERKERREILENGYESTDFPQSVIDLEKVLNEMEEALTKTTWLAADDYSLADLAMTPLIERVSELNCDDWISANRPKLTDWWARIQARPSYQKCLIENPNPERDMHRTAGAKAWPVIQGILSA